MAKFGPKWPFLAQKWLILIKFNKPKGLVCSQKACQINLLKFHCDHIENLSPSSSEAGLATGTEPRKMNPFKFYYLDQP